MDLLTPKKNLNSSHTLKRNTNWDFLFSTLDLMDFGKTLIESKTRESPFSYLFILAVEGLIAALKETVSKRLFKGIGLPGNGPKISSLLSADDACFLGLWGKRNIGNLMKLLRCFLKPRE
ncbi:hypothetical protein OSB04_012109 [Centaurea solstitialis]|uniref:Uncharacterized protein n=1 Tax=Centaurea solstitialis TaxID=347529 RepID=A0AA38WM58_9ASTR|nr:hypothetical protein OSB04_012109 [Centaurea solstitialis]